VGYYYYIVEVKQGDTINSIAERFATSPMLIVRDNRLSTKQPLRVGQSLRVRVDPKKVDVAGAKKRKGLFYSKKKDEDRGFSWGDFLFGSKKSKKKVSSSKVVKISWPVRGRITSRFGMRNGRPHEGVDIAGRRGTNIAAAAAGKVTFSGWQRGYGRTVIISHASGRYSTLYAHLSDIDVDKGDWVATGESIGEVGASGRATGPHLHFELRDKREIPVNPLPYLKRKKQPSNGFLFGSL